MSSFKTIIEKIRNLEIEKKKLIQEIEALREAANIKAIALENEVAALRDEVQALKTLMGEPDSVENQKLRK